MTAIEVLLVVFVVMVTLPFCVNTCVKVGTYAYFKGRQLFQKHEETKDG